MPPKKTDLEQTLEQLQYDLGKLTTLVTELGREHRQETERVTVMEQTLGTIKNR